jgi:hypothetical protein
MKKSELRHMICEEIGQLIERKSVKLGPISQKLMDKKLIWVDPGTEEYVGKAADGEEVAVGVVGYEKNLENYLKTHPTPKHW